VSKTDQCASHVDGTVDNAGAFTMSVGANLIEAAVSSRTMKLVGMFDSPYVRRVAISMRLLDVPFEHANWSIGRDQARIAELNPLGQVPVLVLDDGEPLVESAVILDYLDPRITRCSRAPRSCGRTA
jgi:hypothetical protein